MRAPQKTPSLLCATCKGDSRSLFGREEVIIGHHWSRCVSPRCVLHRGVTRHFFRVCKLLSRQPARVVAPNPSNCRSRWAPDSIHPLNAPIPPISWTPLIGFDRIVQQQGFRTTPPSAFGNAAWLHSRTPRNRNERGWRFRTGSLLSLKREDGGSSCQWPSSWLAPSRYGVRPRSIRYGHSGGSRGASLGQHGFA